MSNKIGERIRKAREELQISQKKLGMALGLSDKAISAYESGRTYPPIDTLYRIAQELKKEIAYFLSDESIDIDIIDKIGLIERKLTELEKSTHELMRLLTGRK